MMTWDNITKENIIKAIKKFNDEQPKVPPSKNTFLKFQGNLYPAKHIRGMAYEIANKKKILKSEYSGGIETVKFFNKLGFDVIYNGQLKPGIAKDICNKAVSVSKVPIEMYIEGNHSNNEDNAESTRNNKKAKAVNNPNDKIKISSRNVVEQKNAFQAVLNKVFKGDIICEKAYPWMKTPGIKKDQVYKKLIDNIHKYRGDFKFAKENYKLKCDFVCDSRKIIFEYDERQHFSEARKIALESYVNDVNMYYDAGMWIKACDDINAKDNSPVNRDEVRAFYDSVRDIEAFRNGYYLIRIMHGQFDWESEGAEEYLRSILRVNNILSESKTFNDKSEVENLKIKKSSLKVGLFLQDLSGNYKSKYKRVMKLVKKEGLDLLVFPEFCYTAFSDYINNHNNIRTEDGYEEVKNLCLNFSEEIGCPIIYSSFDYFGVIYSMYVNPYASENETEDALYIKHTATKNSAFDMNYKEFVDKNFPIINLKNIKIGMTICYDCNHSLFSRMYGVKGVDMIINSTGGNVNKVKWYRYNKARALENNCYNLCTMGYEDNDNKSKSYTFGIGPCGKKLEPYKIIGHAAEFDVPDNVYVYNIDFDSNSAYEEDFTIKQKESVNKKQTFIIDMNNIDNLLNKSKRIDDSIYLLNQNKENIVICIINDSEILKPENVCRLLYSEKLQEYENKKYLIINNWRSLDEAYYKNVLSDILKTRATENFIGVILNAPGYKKCYQSGNIRNAQLVQMVNDSFGMDTSRMSGPETVWKESKTYRRGYEVLLNKIKRKGGS